MLDPYSEEVARLLLSPTIQNVVDAWRVADRGWREWTRIAHSRATERDHYLAALEKIADGAGNPRELAQGALQTSPT